MRKRNIYLVLALLFLVITLQDAKASLENDTTKNEVHNIKEWFQHGSAHGHFRNFFMATINKGELKDYWANATGGMLSFHTASWKGIKLGLGGIFTYNTASSDLGEPDPLTGSISRFERQLFDLEDLENKRDMDRLEEFYIRYESHGQNFLYGKTQITTPLVNVQDGRMKGYGVHGLWTEIKLSKKIKANFGLFDQFTSWGINHWYSTKDAIGLYSGGVNFNGDSYDYHGKLDTDYLIIYGLHHTDTKLKTQLWNYRINNVQSTWYLQSDYKSQHFIGGIQYVHQNAINDGGSTDPLVQYYSPDENANLLGLRVGTFTNKSEVTLNSLTSFNTGRFIFPREFGREQFYTTLGRGRMEGMGGFSTIGIHFKTFPLETKDLDIRMGINKTFAPDPNNFELNKRKFEDFNQLNVDVRYNFHHFIQGTTLRFLYVHTELFNNVVETPSNLFNKNGYHHLNLIININF